MRQQAHARTEDIVRDSRPPTNREHLAACAEVF